MKLVLHTLIVFFGTLAAAGLVALGEPLEAALQSLTSPQAVPAPFHDE
ncbi:hypothetical protein [Ramlibacter henchirensis]|nr:hypothetical protein [Ramlibacter henchirensis]